MAVSDWLLHSTDERPNGYIIVLKNGDAILIRDRPGYGSRITVVPEYRDSDVLEPVMTVETPDDRETVFRNVMTALKHPDPITEFRLSDRAYMVQLGTTLLEDHEREAA